MKGIKFVKLLLKFILYTAESAQGGFILRWRSTDCRQADKTSLWGRISFLADIADMVESISPAWGFFLRGMTFTVLIEEDPLQTFTGALKAYKGAALH